MKNKDWEFIVRDEVDRYMDGVGGERGFELPFYFVEIAPFEYGEGEDVYSAGSDSCYPDVPTYTRYSIVYSTRKSTTVAKMAKAIDEMSALTKQLELDNRYLRDRVTILEEVLAPQIRLWRENETIKA